MANVLVTGGAGFIGANLVQGLLARGHSVIVLDDMSTGLLTNLDGHNVELLVGSILDEQLLESAVREVDSIIHLAAIPSVPRSIEAPRPSHEANATGTLAVLSAARKRGTHVVVASSSSVYGANPTLPKHESQLPMPMSPYAVSKLAAEQYALAFAVSYGMPTLAFRFFNVFGPLQRADHPYAAVVPIFLARALRGEPLIVNGDGTQSRDFTYVGSVVDVLSQVVERRMCAPTPINLAFGGRLTLNELIVVLGRILGRRLDVEFAPERVGDVKHSQADRSALEGLVANLAPTSVEIGLTHTADWMRSVVTTDRS